MSPVSKKTNLTLITNTAGTLTWGHGPLFTNGQVAKCRASFIGGNDAAEKMYLNGQYTLDLIPQGTLAEGFRAAQAGIGGFYTLAGYGTVRTEGTFDMRCKSKTSGAIKSPKKETREFNGKQYLLEEPLYGDFAIVKAYCADKYGNLRYRKTARNFNPDIAGAARVTIAEVEEIVDEIPADRIHTPGWLVDRVFKADINTKKIEFLKTREPKKDSKAAPKDAKAAPAKEVKDAKKSDKPDPKAIKRNRIVKRACKELNQGMYCNLGIGIPGMAANMVMGKIDVNLQGENGIIGIGPYPLKEEVDCDITNASKETISPVKGVSYIRSSDSFGLIRGRQLHLTMLGGMQVSQDGDLANWIVPGAKVTGMGGAMDLVSSGTKVVVTMEHCDPKGNPKVMDKCSLPLTGKGCVSTVITDMGVFEFKNGKMLLTEIAADTTLEILKKKTSGKFEVVPDLKIMED